MDMLYESPPEGEGPLVAVPGPHLTVDNLALADTRGVEVFGGVLGGAPSFTLEALDLGLRLWGSRERFRLMAVGCQGELDARTGRPVDWTERLRALEERGIGYLLHVHEGEYATTYSGLQLPLGPIIWFLEDPLEPGKPASYQRANSHVPELLASRDGLLGEETLVLVEPQPPDSELELIKIARDGGSAYTVMVIDVYARYEEYRPYMIEIKKCMRGALLFDANEKELVALAGRQAEDGILLDDVEECIAKFSYEVLTLATLGPFGNAVAYKGEVAATPSLLKRPPGDFLARASCALRALPSLLDPRVRRERMSIFRLRAKGLVNTCGAGDCSKGLALAKVLSDAREWGWDGYEFRKVLEYVPLDEYDYLVEISRAANVGGRFTLDRVGAFSSPPLSRLESLLRKASEMPSFHSVAELVRYGEETRGLSRSLILDPPRPSEVLLEEFHAMLERNLGALRRLGDQRGE